MCDALQTPRADSRRKTTPVITNGKASVELWTFVPGAPNKFSLRIVSASGCNENKSRTDRGCKKNMAERKAVATPASDPRVPGALPMLPIPNTVAIAKASRGFSADVSNVRAGLGFVVIGFVEIEQNCFALAFRRFFFVKNRIGDHVLFAGPVAQILYPATLAAKRKILVDFRIGHRFANRASMFHGKRFLLSELCGLRDENAQNAVGVEKSVHRE